MKSKITVIGAGSVGATIAYTLSNEDIATEIVLIDINKQKAEGEVMDIIQGTCFRDPISIKSGDYEDAKDSNIVIITSGVARKPGQSRLELTQTNVDIIKSIAPNIAKAAPNAPIWNTMMHTRSSPMFKKLATSRKYSGRLLSPSARISALVTL